MTDFQFISSDGTTTKFVLRTDYIESSAAFAANSYEGNLTVMEIYDFVNPGVKPQDNPGLANNWLRKEYNLAELKQFATANNLTLTATPIGGVEVKGNSTVTLIGAQLATPTNFVASAEAGPKVVLLWVHTPGATQYQIDRATNSGFSTGLVTNINDYSSVNTFEDDSVAASTTYYYRIKAQNPGFGLTDSAYATYEVTTTAE